MERKYIEREEILKLFDGFKRSETLSVAVLEDVIRNRPAVDVINVVRCKDCIHRPSGERTKEENGMSLDFPDDVCPCKCDGDKWYSWKPDDNFYCAYGQRRE